MKAIVQRRLGGPEVLELEDVDRPSPEPTEVLVRVTAAGVNPADWKSRAHGLPVGDVPFIPGWDVAGVVHQVGFGVNRFAVGDRVFGMVRFPHEGRAYAEYVSAPSRQFTRIPGSVGDVQAGALPLAGLTAWQTTVATVDLQPGQRLLVLAAAGSVGSLVAQVAKSRGAHVIGTASARDHDYLRSLGVDDVIDYATQDVATAVSGVDAVIDLVGGATGLGAVPCVRDGGILVTVPSGDSDLEPLQKASAGRIRTAAFLVEPDVLGMNAVATLAGSGRLTARVATTYPLAQAADAHAAAEQGAGGKVVLRP